MGIDSLSKIKLLDKKSVENLIGLKLNKKSFLSYVSSFNIK